MRITLRISIGLTIAFVALVLYDRQKIDPDKFGVDSAMSSTKESWKGVPFTAYELGDVEPLLRQQQSALLAAQTNCEPMTLLWLGNSQLHYINQFQAGDHIAPYWLRSGFDCPDSTVPLALSLPNANLQEHYVLAKYVLRRVDVRLVLLKLVFDDLREDGIRDEFSALLTADDIQALKQDPVAGEIISLAQFRWGGHEQGQENAGLNGFVQKYFEDELNHILSRVFPLWSDRSNLRVHLLTDLYYLRNKVLGIKATTIRKMIAARYVRNMRALEALFQDARQRRIKIIAYVAPIRHDVPLPYAQHEYDAWKGMVKTLANEYGVEFINMENLVPPDMWGTYVGDEIDFMHFRGAGHQLLGKALLPYVRAVASTRRRGS